MTTKRPAGTTMEGMIWNANAVLEAALDPNKNGVPKELFANCHGIVLLSIVTVGLIFSGHGGSGVLMAKQKKKSAEEEDEGSSGPTTSSTTWSAPSAVSVLGYGGGLVLGSDQQDALIFIMDEATLKDFAERPQTRLGTLAAVTVGKHGRQADLGFDVPEKGTVAVYFQKGLFLGAQLEMGTLDARHRQNKKFYGNSEITPSHIIFADTSSGIPPDSGIPELHRKLAMLEEGRTWTPSADDLDKSQKLYASAEKAGQQSLTEDPDVEEKTA